MTAQIVEDATAGIEALAAELAARNGNGDGANGQIEADAVDALLPDEPAAG